MTLYDELLVGAIDLHCHIDLEFSANELKREPEALWLPKAEAMGLRGAVLKSHWGRMDSPELVQKLRTIGLKQVVASTDYFRPYSPNPPELLRMFLGMLYEGGLSKEEVKQVACTNPARVIGLE